MEATVAISRRLVEMDVRFSMALITMERDRSKECMQFAHLARLSLTAYEVSKFIEQLPNAAEIQWQYGPELTAARNSTKFLNRKKQPEAVLLEFAANAVAHRHWFVTNNRVGQLLAKWDWLARLLVEDTAVVRYQGRLIVTSHLAAHFGGLAPGADPSDTQARFTELGSFYAQATSALAIDAPRDRFMQGWVPAEVSYKDAQFEEVYSAMFPGTPLASALALSILWCETNNLSLMYTHMHEGHGLFPSIAKLRFTGFRQVFESLYALNRSIQQNGEAPHIASALQELLEDPHVKAIRSDRARKLRNTLVHYGVDPTEVPLAHVEDPALAVVDAYGFGDSWTTLNQTTEQAFQVLDSFFDSVSGAYEDVLREPHE